MLWISCNAHLKESSGFKLDALDTRYRLGTQILTIAGGDQSYPTITIFCSPKDLLLLRATLDEYLSTLPAEGEVESERKEDVQVALEPL